MPVTQIVVAAVIAFVALFLRGFVGFGSALVMTPLLLFLFDIKTAVVATAVMEVIPGFWIAFQARSNVNRSYLRMLLPISILGIIVGSIALVKLDNDILKRALGLFTIIFALRISLAPLQKPRISTKWPRSVGYLAGAIGGVLGGVFGTSGPPIVIFLENQIRTKGDLRATLLAYFLAVDGLRLAAYAFSMLVTWQVAQISLVMLPASLIGAYLGTKLHVEVSERFFRFGVGIVLLTTGALLAAGR